MIGPKFPLHETSQRFGVGARYMSHLFTCAVLTAVGAATGCDGEVETQGPPGGESFTEDTSTGGIAGTTAGTSTSNVAPNPGTNPQPTASSPVVAPPPGSPVQPGGPPAVSGTNTQPANMSPSDSTSETSGGGLGGGNGGGTGSGADSTDDRPVVVPVDGEVRAFPGASGFAAMATGGRGGRVIKVTTLNTSGPGSLQEALSESGPRIIVFAVSGVIEADILEIYSGDVTIAGQTAPGGGITLKGRLFGAYDDGVGNFIIRHMRIRPDYDGSDGSQFDSVQFSRNHTIMMDHMSVGFGVDETVDLYSAQNVTLQWSTIESPTPEPSHEGGDHNYGLIHGPDGRYIAVHHNLFAHSNNRNPAIANGPADVLNNVMYDVRVGFVHHNPPSGQFRLTGNYFKQGPNATVLPFYFDDYALDDLGYYTSNNWIDGNSECSEGALDNPWQQCDNGQEHDESYRSNADFDFTDEEGYRATPVTSPQQAYADVMAKVGAFPRDVVTRTSIANLEARTGDWGMDLPSNLMEGLTPTTPPADADNDGMADAWETENGLDPSDGDDHSTVMETGYTAIEDYINELAERLIQ